ncbi:MAG: type II toxin-antitoxin system VapB family antitoxin [Candidatus Aminicenantes bacterium]|jgi:Arc/MetJ family transcription regulator
MHKTTVEIDEALLERAMRLSGAKTKKRAIESGLKELIRSISRRLLKEELGTYDIDLTLKDLEKMRKDE